MIGTRNWDQAETSEARFHRYCSSQHNIKIQGLNSRNLQYGGKMVPLNTKLGPT